MKKWILNEYNIDTAKDLASKTSVSLLCAEVLTSKGITTVEQAKDFVEPTELENPLVMADMQKAIDTLNMYIDEGKKICIFGDYDCDGITSTAMLKTYLECMGADVFTYIPEREEGYGMNLDAIDYIHNNGAELIITVDNGISAIKEAEHIYSLGMKLIVTDHHQPSETLPKAEAIVNPHRNDCPSKFKYLCGAGVVFKLIMALEDGNYTSVMEQFGDLVAIATIGDVVSITGENRKLVLDGLQYIKNSDRLGLTTLCEVANIKLQDINSTKVAFGIVPRINASGRFGSPKTALSLLTCEDEEEAVELSKLLCDLNNQRKQTEDDITKQIYKYIEGTPECTNQRVLVFNGDDWHHGVIGIVASRFCEVYDKPCYIITNEKDGISRGSARGVGKFSIFESLSYCSQVLETFGGHQGAGGFSLKTEDIPKFKELLQQYADEHFKVMPRTNYYIDKVLTPEDLYIENVKGLNILEPFGEGNKEPIFLIPNAVLIDIVPLANNTSVKFKILYDGKYLDIVQFRTPKENVFLKKGLKYNFLVRLSINYFRGNESISLMAIDYRMNNINQMAYYYALDTYEKFALHKPLSKEYLQKLCPNREDLVLVFSYIHNSGSIDLDTLYAIIDRPSIINFGKLRVCIDIFCELGLTTFNSNLNSVKVNPNAEKVSLENSTILRRIKSDDEQQNTTA